MFVIIVSDTSSEIISRLCALEHRPSALGMLYGLNHPTKDRKRRELKVEITSTLDAENDRPPQLSLAEVKAAEVPFRQPTAAEVSLLAFSTLRDDRSQELSNEFARLLNRGSSLE